MFAKDLEKHAKQINEDKECDMKSSYTTNKMTALSDGNSVKPKGKSAREISSPHDQRKKKKKGGGQNLEHLSSFKDIKIDESCAMSDDDNDSVEEHSNKETETVMNVKKMSMTNGLTLDAGKDQNEIISSDDNFTDDAAESNLTTAQSGMLRSKSFMSIAPSSDLFHLTKSHSKSRKYSSTINLAQDGLQNEVITEGELGYKVENDTTNASMKPPMHPPLPPSKFGIARKSQRKNLSLDNGWKQVVGFESPSTQRKSDAGGVVLRREKTEFITSPTKLQNRLSWNNSSLKGSKNFGGSTNSLIEFIPDNHTQHLSGLPKAPLNNSRQLITDVCVKDLANKPGCRSGYLSLKKGTGFKTYKKYWCVVDENEGLFYICSKDSKKAKHVIPLFGCLVTKDGLPSTPGIRDSQSGHHGKDRKKNEKQFELIPYSLSVEKSDGNQLSSSSNTRPKSEATGVRHSHSQTISKRMSFITSTADEADNWVKSFQEAIERSTKNEGLYLDLDVTDSLDYQSPYLDAHPKHKSLQSTPTLLVKQISKRGKDNEESEGRHSAMFRREKSGFLLRRPKSDLIDEDISISTLERRDSWHGKQGQKVKKKSSFRFSKQDSSIDKDKELNTSGNSDISNDISEKEKFKSKHKSR